MAQSQQHTAAEAANAGNPRYRFGRFELRPHERRLLVGGQAAPLGSRAFDVLVTLVERRASVVTKDELLDSVWPGLVVEEANVQVQVSALRKVLGPDAVVTVARRGYRFAMPVDITEAAPALAAPTGAGRDTAVAARGRVDAHTDGVWCIDLAAVGGAARLVAAIASTMRLRGGDADRGSLARAIAASDVLIVLDSGGHLDAALSALASEPLERALRVRLLMCSCCNGARKSRSVAPEPHAIAAL